MLGAWTFLHATDALLGARFTASLGMALAGAGKRVLLFDLSPEIPALDAFLGVDGQVVYTLTDVTRIPPIDAALSPHENLFFIPIGTEDEVSVSDIALCMDAFSANVVLFSASRSTLPLASASSDGTLLLSDASPIAMRASCALSSHAGFDGFVLTDFVPDRKELEGALGLTEILDAVGLPLLGILPRVSPYSPRLPESKDFLAAVENMAGRISGEQIPLLRGIAVKEALKEYFFKRISE